MMSLVKLEERKNSLRKFNYENLDPNEKVSV